MDVKFPLDAKSRPALPALASADVPPIINLNWGVSGTGDVQLTVVPRAGVVDPIIPDLALHMCVFRNDPVHVLTALCRSGLYDVNGLDLHDNTPLHLCAMMNRLEHARVLITYGAHNKTRNRSGWTPTQEAVSYGDREMIKLLWVMTKSRTKSDLKSRAPQLLNHLRAMGDFSLRIHWQFSSWIPFVSRFCPSDDYHISKKGTSIRIDTTLADFKGLSWRRGDISFIITFDDGTGVEAPADGAATAAAAAAAAATDSKVDKKDAAAAPAAAATPVVQRVPKETVFVLDNEARTYSKISGGSSGGGGGEDDDDGIDDETDNRTYAERLADLEEQVTMIMGAPNNSTTSPGRFRYTRALAGFIGFRQPRVDTVGAYKADIYDVADMKMRVQRRLEHLSEAEITRINEMQSTMKNANLLTSRLTEKANELENEEKTGVQPKRTPRPFRPSLPSPPPPAVSFDAYFAPPTHIVAAPSAAATDKKAAPAAAATKGGDAKTESSAALYAYHLGRPVRVKEEMKQYTATVGMCHNFPLSLNTVIGLLDIVTPVHRNVEKLTSFLRNKMPPGFPVKLEMPIFPTISAQIQFLDFQTAAVPADRFMIPGNYSLAMRPGQQAATADDLTEEELAQIQAEEEAEKAAAAAAATNKTDTNSTAAGAAAAPTKK